MVRGTVVSLSVDDCWRQHALSLATEFESAGLRGVFYPITGFVGSQQSGISFVDWNDLKGLAARGHEVGSHTVTHSPIALGRIGKASRLLHQLETEGFRHTLRRTRNSLGKKPEYTVKHLDLKAELIQSREAVESAIGAPCRSFSYPGGAFTQRFTDLVRAAGYSSARTGYSGLNLWESLRPYALLARSWDSHTTANRANEWVDAAIGSSSWLIEVFHAVDLEGYLYSCKRTELVDHLAYLKTRASEIETLTVGDVL